MIRKTKEYHYQQINDSGDNHISRIKESSIPRIEKDYSYTVIKTVTTTTSKGSNSLNNFGSKNLSSTKNNKNYKSYSKYSNTSKDKKDLKCTCPGDHEHAHEDKNKKNTSYKYAEEKKTSVTYINEGNKRGKTVDNRSLNKYSTKSENNISKVNTSGGLQCTCGKDHNLIKISSDVNSKYNRDKKTIEGEKKYISGTYKISNTNNKTSNAGKSFTSNTYRSSSVANNLTNKDYKTSNVTNNLKSITIKNTKQSRVSSVDNYRRGSNSQKECTCGLDHSKVKSENKYYKSNVQRKYNYGSSNTYNSYVCTCGDLACQEYAMDLANCTCGLDHTCTCGLDHEKEEMERKRRLDEQRRKREKEKRKLEILKNIDSLN